MPKQQTGVQDSKSKKPEDKMFKKNSISINHRMIISIMMTLFLVAAAIVPMALPQLANADATTIFVDAGATGGTYNGDSWATAYTTLYEALTDAQTSSKDIWVAAGTYYPDTSGLMNIRIATFQMINGVAIYGGFAGTEDPVTFDLGKRDFVASETVLSGNIGSLGDDSDNCYHVFFNLSGLDNTAVLDGFTISGGYAPESSGSDESGAGMLNYMNEPTVINCTFTGNYAGYAGGGMMNFGSDPTVINCTFTDNSAELGGGMYNSENSAPSVINCTFFGNLATDSGGGMYNGPSSPTVTNCILWGDTPDEIFNNTSTLVVTYSDIDMKNPLTSPYTGTGNINADPLFYNPAVGDFRLTGSSPCIDTGNNAAVPSGITHDINGDPRIVDTTVDMGADEFPIVGGPQAPVPEVPTIILLGLGLLGLVSFFLWKQRRATLRARSM